MKRRILFEIEYNDGAWVADALRTTADLVAKHGMPPDGMTWVGEGWRSTTITLDTGGTSTAADSSEIESTLEALIATAGTLEDHNRKAIEALRCAAWLDEEARKYLPVMQVSNMETVLTAFYEFERTLNLLLFWIDDYQRGIASRPAPHTSSQIENHSDPEEPK